MKDLKKTKELKEERKEVKVRIEKVRHELFQCMKILGQGDRMTGLINDADFCLFRALKKG